jgi:ribose transport system ATP-binding protein
MVGRELSDLFPPRPAAGTPAAQPPLLRVRGLTVPGGCADIDLDVPGGRIVGLGGLQGQGQREVLRALFGLSHHSGVIELDGRPCRLATPRQAIRHGIAYVPEDRKTEGLHVAQSLRANLALPSMSALAPATRLTTVARSAESRLVDDLISRLQIKAASPRQQVRRLSGGNQQKAALAKWLPAQPRILLLAEPTRGIDMGTKREIYHLLRGLADTGLAIVITSGDTIELVGLCDEVAVMYEGRIIDRLAGQSLTEERLVHSSVTGAGSVASA